jgi:hypothetical protein
MKTEFLVQFESKNLIQNQILELRANAVRRIIATSSRPGKLDAMIRRRFPKRIHIPMIQEEGRRSFLGKEMPGIWDGMRDEEFEYIIEKTDG